MRQQEAPPEGRTYRVACLPGDGIGSAVTDAAQTVLAAAAQRFGFTLQFDAHLIGGAAIDATGAPLPATTQAACRAADAVLLGAVGGPRWEGQAVRPEQGLLALRQHLGVFANLRPVQVPPALVAASPLRAAQVAGTDLLIVRELTGGVYFGQPSGITGEKPQRVGVDTMRYTEAEIERIARVAFDQARQRRGRVTSVDKANVLASSRLWREVVTTLQATEYAEVTLQHLYVDNAAMQLVRAPCTFDVLLTANLFGDILSDLAATLPGSLGLLPSASLGGGVGVFEPVHGSAPDLVGQGTANPLAAIASGAMLLRTLGEEAAAGAVEQAIAAVLAQGYRTPDLASPGEMTVGTAEMTEAVCEALAAASVEVGP